MKRSIKMAVSEKVLMAVIYLVMILFCLCVIGPFMNIIAVSFSGRNAVTSGRVSLWPVDFNVEAYKKVLTTQYFGRAYLNTVLIVLAGTPLSLAVTVLMAYPLSRSDLPGKRALTFILTLTMWFSGGMIPSFILVNKLGLYDSYWALILPICCSSFNIIIMRTFFTTTVPDEMIESGKIDGANQLRIFAQLVLPICLPALATIALFLTFAYWNEWYLASIYISSNRTDLFPLQYILVSIEEKIQFLINNAGFMGADAQDMPSETMRMAIVVIAVVPIMFAYPFFQKYYISGLTVGAVKG